MEVESCSRGSILAARGAFTPDPPPFFLPSGGVAESERWLRFHLAACWRDLGSVC